MIRKIFYILVFVFSLTSCLNTRTINQKAIYENVGPYLYYYEGIQNRLYGNSIESIKNLEKSLLLNSNNSAVYYEIALSYSNLNQYDSAIINLEEAVEIEPDNKYYRNFLGFLYMNQGMYEKALTNQLILEKIDSTNISYKYQIALIYSNLSHFEKALNYLNLIENQAGFLPNVSETRSKIYLQQNKLDKANEEISNLINLYPQNPIYYLYKSDLEFREGKDSLGFENIRKSIDINPDLPISQIELYQRLSESGFIEEAITTLKSIFSINNLAANEKSNLFYPILFEQTYYQNFGLQLDTVISIGLLNHPNSIALQEIAFEHFLRRNNFNSAREKLIKLIELDQNNPSRLDKLISFEYSLKLYDEALNSITKGIISFPQYYIFYIYKALIEDERGRTMQAIESVKHGIKNITDKNNLSELYGTLGDLYYKLGDRRNTFKSYDKSLDNSIDNARVLNNYSYYLAINNKKLSKALEMSTQAVIIEPNNSTYIDTKGWVLFQMGKYEEAKDVLRNAVAKDGNSSAVINEHYGDALYKSGNKDSAYIYWLKAKELGEENPKLEEKLRTKTYVP